MWDLIGPAINGGWYRWTHRLNRRIPDSHDKHWRLVAVYSRPRRAATKVDSNDFYSTSHGFFVDFYATTPPQKADVNLDGNINSSDYFDLLADSGTTDNVGRGHRIRA